MKILQKNSVNLEKVADGIGIEVAELIALDDKGETKLFDGVMECFEWLFIDDYKRVENVRPLMLKMASLKHTDLTGSVAELMIEEQNTVKLEDGRVAFVYM